MLSNRAELILGLMPRAERWQAGVFIAPETAKRILEAQPQQRPVNQRHVENLMREMQSGRFVRTNEGIAFDQDGLLFDGQHRLWACFMSGTTIEVLCCFNEPRANFRRIGTVVQVRKVAEHLSIEGLTSVGDANTITAAARFIQAYNVGLNPVQSQALRDWNADLAIEVVRHHPGLHDAFRACHANRKVPLPLGPLVALMTMFAEASPQRAAIFRHQVLSGEGLVAGDPALTLRESALARSVTPRGHRTEMTYRIARAWNAFVAGRRIARLYGSHAPGTETLRKGGMDPFPEIAGYRRSGPTLPAAAPGEGG